MNTAFESLPDEKKQMIINACIEEFGINGYEKASTNSIVRRAEISKGALFNYFGNKRRLFLYIFDYSLEYLTRYYLKNKGEQPADLFERFTWYSMLKMKAYIEKPSMARLVTSAVTNMPEELSRDIEERIESLYATYLPEFLSGADTSKFREGIDERKAMELVSIFIEGLFNKYIKEYRNTSYQEILKDFEKIIEEYNEYFKLLKYCIYKK